MINSKRIIFSISVMSLILMLYNCQTLELTIKIYETSESGNKLTLINESSPLQSPSIISINFDQKFQTIYDEKDKELIEQLNRECEMVLLNNR